LKLTSDTRARLAKLIRLLGSDNAGEVAAAAHKLQAVLRSSGADLHDLAAMLEEERMADPGVTGEPGNPPGSPPPPPQSRSPRRPPPGRASNSSGKLTLAAACILTIGAFVGAALAVRGLSDSGSQRTIATAAMPAQAPPVIQSSPAYEVVTATPRPAPEPAPPVEPAPPPPEPVPQAMPAPPQPAAAVTEATALPRPKPVVARQEPAPERPDARNAARSAVGEMIRQIRFPQRVDSITSMVSISAYGSEIVASYRAAVADETMNTDALRRFTLERACEVPIMMSALNRGATHRARYTDLNGHVAEVVISAKDCEP
jgi:hypothetical protein